MTVNRLREARAGTEQRIGAFGLEPGWSDPAAIPPNGHNSIRAGVPVNAHTALQVDAVFTALRVISNAVIKLGDLRAYRWAQNTDNLPYREWLAKQPSILTNSFGRLFQYDGRRRSVMSLALFGEAFWYVLTRDRLQYPTTLEVLHPAFMKVEHDSDGHPVYTYGSGSERKQLDREDVIHIPFMAMPGAARGLSSIEYAGISYALALAAMDYGQRWFSQGASPSFLLSTEQKLGNEEVKRIAERFLIDHSGLQAAHLPLVVDHGLKAEKISATPDEAQFINTLEYARMCIAAYFGLPAHLIGGTADKGNVWGKTVEEQGIQMDEYSISGYTVPLAEAHSSLLPRGQFAGFEDSAPRASSADMATEISALRANTVATANDIRVRKLKWPPVEGGDDINAPLASNVAPGAPKPDDNGDGNDDEGRSLGTAPLGAMLAAAVDADERKRSETAAVVGELAAGQGAIAEAVTVSAEATRALAEESRADRRDAAKRQAQLQDELAELRRTAAVHHAEGRAAEAHEAQLAAERHAELLDAQRELARPRRKTVVRDGAGQIVAVEEQ